MESPDKTYDVQKQRRLEEQVETLLTEVNALEGKLGDLHATDVSSLRRAYKSLAQHVQALDVESRHLPALLERATESSLTPDFVAEQVQVLASVTAVVYGVGRLLSALRIQEVGPITAGLALLGGCYAGFRLLKGTLQRMGATARRRHRAVQELRSDLRVLRERVQVMVDLAESGLQLHRLHPSQQMYPQLQPPLPSPLLLEQQPWQQQPQQQPQSWSHQQQQPQQPQQPWQPQQPQHSVYPSATHPASSALAGKPVDDSGW